MGFLVFIVLVVGYTIFQDFWWLLWMPAALFLFFFAWLLCLEFWNGWLTQGGFEKISMFLLKITGVWYIWSFCVSTVGQRSARRTCVVCQNWVPSLMMLESLADSTKEPLMMCKKHAASRDRIWKLEEDLGLDLTGVRTLTAVQPRNPRRPLRIKREV